jgi:hypothetical protein
MRNYFILAIVSLLLGIGVGYYLMPEKIKTEVRTVEVEKKVEVDMHKTTTITKKPDGTTQTVITDNTVARSSSENKQTDQVIEQVVRKSILNVSGLIGTSFPTPVYGLSINKNFIGPITVGLWGLSNKTLGFSLGLNL